MDEDKPVSRPKMVDPTVWERTPPGRRIRMLRWAEDEVPLDPQQYFELRRLPFWVFYGPESGLPEAWFNPRGFLLPRFRPGGPDHDRFLTWRRGFRRRRYLARRVVASLRRWWREWGIWLGLSLSGLFVTLCALLQRSARDQVQSGLEPALLLLAPWAVGIVLVVLVSRLRYRALLGFVRWRIRRVLEAKDVRLAREPPFT